MFGHPRLSLNQCARSQNLPWQVIGKDHIQIYIGLMFEVFAHHIKINNTLVTAGYSLNIGSQGCNIVSTHNGFSAARPVANYIA